jgi:3-hydroxyacyl-CoA dehydrogenase/enoyl-CoA hydratase/3-hydroxybutyryl-CoA epimerase
MGISQADVVIEAVSEKIAVKESLYKKIESQLKSTAILATNTSSLPLDQLCQFLKDPTRLVGIHFFNPVAKMTLVEIVQGEKTDPKCLEQAIAFVRRIDRLPLPVKSCPGFLVTRVLIPYLMEAMTLLDEGHAPEVIDQAALAFGMPMGPIELADTVGLDICLSVAEVLMAYKPLMISEKLKQKIAEKQFGRKSGAGFYVYQKGKKVQQKVNAKADQSLIDRLILPMINESITCLQEKIVTDADLLDAGLIFGAGFAPFRGGPSTYAKENLAQIIEKLHALQQQHGDRFKPADGWDAL